MKAGQTLWTRKEMLLTLDLYLQLPFGRYHSRNPQVMALAAQMGRTAGAVAYRLGNFASVDPTLAQRGLDGGGKKVKLFWAECAADWNATSLAIAQARAEYAHLTVEQLVAAESPDDPVLQEISHLPPGRSVTRLVQTRVNQQFFRRTVLVAYDQTCCLTGLREPGLLVASHIRPWAEDEANRTNPRNGLALNALHDRAFDRGFFTLTDDCRVRVSPALRHAKRPDTEAVRDLLLRYDGATLRPPRKTHFRPDPAFLAAHRRRWEATW